MIAADSPFAWGVVAAVGAAIGRLLTVGTVPLVACDLDGRPVPVAGRTLRAVEIACVAVAVALWWWEVVAAGLQPRSGGLTLGSGLVLPRYAGHLVLFALLAAAAWVDLRLRIIPDVITTPGVVVGLAWSTLASGALLPIAVEVPRSFAGPLVEPDVLGLAGGLRSVPLPWWLAARPGVAGLVVAWIVYGGWWATCTAPFFVPSAERNPTSRILCDPRGLVLVAGGLGIAAAWWHGGPGWHGLLTSLAGLAVAAGMIWLTRAGASRALGREAMGFGDVTLMAMVGAWIGWQASVLVCFGAVFIGLLHGVRQLVRHRDSELPFGPSLCLAAAGVVVGWRPLWERAGELFGSPGELAAVIVAVIGLTAASLWCWRRVRPFPAE